MSREGWSIQVELIFSEENDFVKIDVLDDGLGISKGQLDKIWGDASTKSDKTRVRGLGTQIVAFLCDKLSIEIKVNSEIGSGTRFTLRVPK